MTETEWKKAVERLHKGYTVRIDDDSRIIPFVSENGVGYSFRCGCNCIIYTPDLDRIRTILFWKPKRKGDK